MPPSIKLASAMAADADADKTSAKRLIDALDPGYPAEPPTKRQRRRSEDAARQYFASRQQVMQKEQSLSFESRCRARQSPLEKRVDAIIRALKARDDRTVYGVAPRHRGHAGQTHPRLAGDHYLSNVDLITQTAVFDVARRMPKGAHLHIHFNACLAPSVLLNIAKGMDRMFISSSLPLARGGEDEGDNYARCEIRFSICAADKENPGDLFSADYKPWQTMKFSEFLRRFDQLSGREGAADEWLLDKVVFHDDEAYNIHQTAAGAWEKFNARTRMMKGLFNYESAYRRYTRLCLEDFARDNIQWAEIRPNFMTSNHVHSDDGTRMIDNRGIMRIIIDEVERFKRDVAADGGFFGGLKVIYCTPRSFGKAQVKASLDECLQFKKEWPQWIAGFDLVGEEAAGYSLQTFVPEFLQFQKDCASEGVHIPFLFHCGETLDDPEGNLVDALLLGAPRIGHGFALARHPYVLQLMRSKGVCVELCPISNEVLGLTGRVGGHAMYALLANNVHCTVNSDNGTMFRSSLSHDFYQTMIGNPDMGLAGWKQLILWSIEHACMDDAERAMVLEHWGKQWQGFLEGVVQLHGDVLATDGNM